jgi:tetratricopeptide (TPR) repeat protein
MGLPGRFDTKPPIPYASFGKADPSDMIKSAKRRDQLSGTFLMSRRLLSSKTTLLIALAAFAAGSATSVSASVRTRGHIRAEVPPDRNSLLGAYLAGHVARTARDSDAAALFYRRALEKDPSNEEILDDAFELELAAGNFDEARNLAQRLLKRQNDAKIARIFLGLDAFKRHDYVRADENFKLAEGAGSAEEPTVKLSRAWTLVAENRADKAIAALQTPSKAAWATHFETVQRAFIADVARKKQAAEEAFRAVLDGKAPSARVAEAFARHFAVWGDKEQAKKILAESGADETPYGKALLADLKAGRPPKLMVSTVDEGLAETLLGIGQVLATNNGIDAAQIYLRLALFLNPQSDIAKLELAELYGTIEQYDKAIKAIDTIAENSPLRLNSQVRKALYLNAKEKPDEAVGLLKDLLVKNPDEDQILQTLATIESARKHFDAALPYYTRTIEKIAHPEKRHWQLFYARGIAYERTKQWDKAEPDFKKAIELDPEQGAVLNYLGYSWLDQNMNIPEAFDLIKRAVKLRPNDGYIIDSLGWAYYLQKNYQEAVKNLDKAVELRPEDPTLNDHLGDVYWRLGRLLEAKFQWRQALTLSPEPEDAEKIKKKIEAGLPDESGPRAELAPPTPAEASAPASSMSDEPVQNR